MNFIGCALIFAFIAQTYGYDLYENATVEDYCLKQAGITKEDLDNATSSESNSEEMGSLPEDIKCYYYCVLTQLGFLSEEGEIKIEQFKADPEFAEDLDLECLKKIPKLLECDDLKLIDECGKESNSNSNESKEKTKKT